MIEHPVLAGFYAAYNAHDAKAAVALYTLDGRHDEISMGKSRSGHVDLREGLDGFFKMLPDVCWTPSKVVRSADWLAVSYHMTGTFTAGAKDGSAPVAHKIALDGLHLFKLQGDAIEITQDYWDKDVFLSQISSDRA
ncbi:nuclear transport factor 2 family protein [Pacificibacter sp. AS14]|uniref:nuclear transport factor 2 family protein n=1 Tax=Pacificibacter sp. AS14 TaxID=3135785 RepID=UPI00316F8118